MFVLFFVCFLILCGGVVCVWGGCGGVEGVWGVSWVCGEDVCICVRGVCVCVCVCLRFMNE